ncbi:TetR/AcrR family transcriptional regulator [Microbacterium sp. KUDC0406]|uniref:TetR/AcrR family transcriptional regulator n=1 Tax=Microbacterium sp. KUDC0406 TaxID=2909588 RepID=UPI001F1F3B99|nr:TetR/AcrR family transcriptional regulator [Microbacterium sp. KUDC0406]UJP11267.1 TetR/AcrR family transcriptional regulator [Microbacterium sp. KUDC0406]
MTAPQTARRGRPGYSREEVLRIAVALFNEQGYDATSVSDLAARLGLTKSALYHHFDSKAQLLELALDSALGGLEGAMDVAMERSTVAEQLDEGIRGAVRVLTAQQPQVTLLLRLRGNSPVEVAALQRRRAFDQRVSSLVRRAQREGLLRDDIGAGTITRLIFGMINSIVEWYRPDGAIDPQGLADDVLAVAIDGLRRPTAR